MDKAWVNLPRPTAAYREGVRNFVTVSLESLGNPSKIRCPCTRCRNLDYQTSDDVVSHLVIYGMDKTYDVWIFHGEERPSTSSKMTCDLGDISDTYRMFIDARVNEETIPNYTEAMGDEGFSKLLEDAETPKPPNYTYHLILVCLLIFKSKIQEITSSQTSHLTSISKDALSQIFGPERNGRVRGMGFGITPSKIGIHMNSSKKVQALENQVSELNKKIEKFEHLENEMAEMRHFMRMQGFASKEKANSNMASPHLHIIGSRDNLNGKSPTPSSHNGSSNVRDCYGSNSRDSRTSVVVDRKCKLLDWRKKVLDEATIASTYPNAMVHGVPVGNDAWKVWVQVALVPNADLWRPNSDMSVIADAVGSTTAWPKEFVSFN